MEKLSDAQRADIKKMPTVRLATKLMASGMPEEEVEKLDRAGLMENWARTVLEGKDKPAPVVPTAMGYDPAIEKERLEFEKRKFELEMKKMELQAQMMAEEKAERARREEIEAKRIEEEKAERARQKEEDRIERLRREEVEQKERLRHEALEMEKMERERADKFRREGEERAERLKREEEERAERAKQLEQMEIQNDLRRREIELQEAKNERDEKGQDSKVARIKRFGDAMKNAMSRMPNDPMELVSYFECMEQLFKTLGVGEDIKVTLLRPYLNDRARNLLVRYDPLNTADYEKVKQYLLQEFHLSPQVYLERFNTVVRNNEDTYVLFCAKLKSLIEYYVKSRKIAVSKDPSYLRVLSLLICDRIKSSLPDHILRHILAMEATCKDGWLPHNELAEAIDLYMANHLYDGKPRGGAIGVTGKPYVKPPYTQGQYPGPKVTSQYPQSLRSTVNFQTGNIIPGQASATRPPRLCHHCSSPSHIIAHCPMRQNQNQAQPNSSTRGIRNPNGRDQRDQSLNRKPNGTARIHTAQANDAENETALKQIDSIDATVNKVSSCDVNLHETVYDDFIDAVYGRTHSTGSTLSTRYPDIQYDNVVQDDFVNNNTVLNIDPDIVENDRDVCANEIAVQITDPVEIEFAELHRIDVFIKGVERGVKCLEDSGAQIGIVRSDVLSDVAVKRVGTVKLRGIFGSPVEADLVQLHVKLSCDVNEPYTPIVVAMCDSVYEEMILTCDIVNRLMTSRDAVPVTAASVDPPMDNIAVNDRVDNATDNVLKPSDTVQDEELQLRRANAETLLAEQLKDVTLTNCWALAKAQKGDYFIHDGLLYHRDVVVGQPVSQLCLPTRRRDEVMKLAHDVHGGHLSFRKSRDRIRLSFFWPMLKTDLLKHIQHCFECQTRARITYRDRVPITPIPRAQTPFTHWVMDCFGPILGSQKIEYPYCLLLCDSATRFPWAHPLRTLTAKGVCDALLQLFSFTGVASQCVISSDQGSNFTAQLTQEFLKRLGVSPRFNTPGHPQAAGLCERLVQSTKRIIGKLAHDSPRSWQKHLNCTMWALREVPNETTGISPFQAVFGILPKGPLAILKEHWCGETDLPLDLSKGTADYLKELRNKLETAQSFVNSHTTQAQQRYARYYNLRSKDKHFSVGEQVIILMPDSTASKTFSRWRGPAVIVEKRSPYSYIVEINGARQHIHANHLRKFYAQVEEITCAQDCFSLMEDSIYRTDIGEALNSDYYINASSCAIVHDEDIDFGVIHVIEPSVVNNTGSKELLPSQKIDLSVLSHLSSEQSIEFLAVLDRFPECFSDTPGCNQTVMHEIHITPDFKPKRLKPYRIPEALKDEVNKQIANLLKLGFVQPSKSEMASPVVCVMKGKDIQDGVRIAIDYRWVNKYSLGDAYPLSDPSEVLQKMGQAKYISTFDTKSGYHQTVVEPTSRWLTAFVCGDQLLEWTRTPFGLKGAGYTFVRMLQRVLQPISQFTTSFIDDISVYSNEWSNHLQHVERFLQIIKDAGLTLNLKKSVFAQGEVKFIGHLVGSGKRRADPQKLATVRNMKVPETKRQVRQIIGFFSFFRDYIPRFADHARVLTDLTAKRASNLVHWTSSHQEAFKTLKDLLCKATIEPLYIIDFARPFNIHVDASDFAVAGFLSQTSDDGTEKPIAFASNKLTRTQQNWSTIEREAFAAIWSLQKFRQWIFGSEVTLYSDHNPLTFLTESAPKSSKLMRWSLALAEFSVKFKFTPGTQNSAADCLSRVGSEDWDRQDQSVC